MRQLKMTSLVLNKTAYTIFFKQIENTLKLCTNATVGSNILLTSSLKPCRSSIFFFAEAACFGETGDFRGDFRILGETGLLRKLPCILWGEGIPGMWGSGAWVWLIWLMGVSSITDVFTDVNPGRCMVVLVFIFVKTGLWMINFFSISM